METGTNERTSARISLSRNPFVAGGPRFAINSRSYSVLIIIFPRLKDFYKGR